MNNRSLTTFIQTNKYQDKVIKKKKIRVSSGSPLCDDILGT